MAIEIERRFLIPDCSMALDGPATAESLRIRQGYFGQVNGLRVGFGHSCMLVGAVRGY